MPWLSIAILFPIPACDRGTPPPPPPAAQPNRASPAGAATRPDNVSHDTLGYVRGATPQASSTALPAGHPPIDSATTGGQAARTAEEATSLKYTDPPGWVSQPPANPMRVAQFQLPRAAGDPEDGLVTVSRVGGPVDMNIARWLGMFKTADGQPVGEAGMKRETFEVNGLKVTVVDVTGRYSDAMTRGETTATAGDFRLLGGVVEDPPNNWYFKATGPAATMAQHYDAFMALMRSVQRS
jgi:hypothetical protein